MKKIILTGGTGFIGSHLVEKLLKLGFELVLIIRKNSKKIEKRLDVTWIEYDGTYKSLEEKSLKDVDLIIHLATFFKSNHDNATIKDLVNSNVLFGTHLLELATNIGCRKIINTSSYAQSIDDSEYNPQNLYTATKKAYEDILEFYTQAYEMQAISLVLFDTYGPNDTRMKFINLLIDAVKEKHEFKMSFGEQQICYVHVNDVVEGFVRTIELIKDCNKVGHRKYSIYTDEVLRLKELVQLVLQINESNIEVDYGYYPYRKREIMYFSPRYELLPGFKPKISIFEGVKGLLT